MLKFKTFTLLEILIVVAIIGFIAGISVKKYIEIADGAKIDLAKAQVEQISDTLDIYKIRNGNYPSTDEGLYLLVEGKETALLDKVPTDPWNREFNYDNPSRRDKKFDVYTLGADGVEGGEWVNADIYND